MELKAGFGTQRSVYGAIIGGRPMPQIFRRYADTVAQVFVVAAVVMMPFLTIGLAY